MSLEIIEHSKEIIQIHLYKVSCLKVGWLFGKEKRDYLSPSGSIWDLQKWISRYVLCSIGWLGSRSPPLVFWEGLLNRCMYWVGHGVVRLCKLNYILEWLDSPICVYWSYFKPWKSGVQIWFCSRCPKKVEYILVSSRF